MQLCPDSLAVDGETALWAGAPFIHLRPGQAGEAGIFAKGWPDHQGPVAGGQVGQRHQLDQLGRAVARQDVLAAGIQVRCQGAAQRQRLAVGVRLQARSGGGNDRLPHAGRRAIGVGIGAEIDHLLGVQPVLFQLAKIQRSVRHLGQVDQVFAGLGKHR